MPESGFDKWIDAELRNVPLPPDFLARLSECTRPSDQSGHDLASPDNSTLPQRSQRVDSGNSERANTNNAGSNGRQRPSRSPDVPPPNRRDPRLDSALNNVPVPEHLESQLFAIAREGQSAPSWRHMGLAASLLLCATLSGAVAIVWMSATIEPESSRVAQHANRPAEAPAKRAAPGLRTPAAQSADQGETLVNLPNSSPAPLLANDAGPAAEDSSETAPAAEPEGTRRGGFSLIKGMAVLSTSLKQAIASKRQAMALGSSGDLDPLPQLDALEVPTPRGIAPPRVKGYNLLYQLKHNEHPFVATSAHESFVSSQLPWTFRTTSYDTALSQVRAGQLPSADEIRVEEFLAAQDYELPASPPGGVGVHVAAGPSLFGERGLHVLEIAVKAGKVRSYGVQGTHLLVAIDNSARMRNSARAESVTRSLLKLTGQMAPADRVTLLTFAEHVKVVAKQQSRDELRAMVTSNQFAPPAGLADLTEAIRGLDVELASANVSMPQRVVIMTAGGADLDDADLDTSGQVLAQWVGKGIPWQAMSLATGEMEERLTALAERGQGQVAIAHCADDLYRAMLEKIASLATVAQSARVKVTFNPKVVTSYRLVGHEATTLTGPVGDPLEIDLIAGQTALGMYELWIKPGGGDQVASIETTWIDPSNGKAHRVVRPLNRDRVAASFAQAPGWFQHAALAAKTAEALRGSSYVPGSRALGQLAQLTDEVEPATARGADFQTLVELIKQAKRLR